MSAAAPKIQFKPAVRRPVPLLIGLSGGTGAGKTWTGMALATGMAAGEKFAVIDTENGRALHYADQWKFDHAELHPPFTPKAYENAILAADAAGYPVIMVDSASHEWAGEGGVLDTQEDELTRMAGQDFNKRNACLMASWIKPKREHKSMVQRLLQVKAHVILCFRAEPKVEMVTENNKTKVVPKKSLTGLDGWIPVSEKNLPFELTLSFLLTADKPGIPHPIKLQDQHRPYFDLTKPVGIEAGRKLAEWAKGDEQKPAAAESAKASAKSASVTQYTYRLRKAVTLKELQAIGSEISGSALSDTDKDACRKVYTEEQARLSQ